jgi:hypothetical protein
MAGGRVLPAPRFFFMAGGRVRSFLVFFYWRQAAKKQKKWPLF